MRLIITFLRAYPLQSAIMLGAMIFAGLIEGVGFSLLLPLLTLATDINTGSGGKVADSADSTLSQAVNSIFDTIGFTPTIGKLLIIFVACMILKALLRLVMSKRVGYMTAQVSTDLRLDFMHALFGTRWEFFIRQPLGSLAVSIGGETGVTANAYFNTMTMLAALLQALVYAAIVFLVSWQATLIAIAAGILILFMVGRYIRKSRRVGKRLVALSDSYDVLFGRKFDHDQAF